MQAIPSTLTFVEIGVPNFVCCQYYERLSVLELAQRLNYPSEACRQTRRKSGRDAHLTNVTAS